MYPFVMFHAGSHAGPDDVVESNSVVPMGLEGDVLIVAVLESCEDGTLCKIRFICNCELRVFVVTEAAMAYATQRYVVPK